MNLEDWKRYCEGRKGSPIQLVSGRPYWPQDPRPAEVFIEDMAHALSIEPRFGAHSREHYPVAQHCCLVHDYVRDHYDTLRYLLLAAVLHDGHEAYLRDIQRPLKNSPEFDAYRALVDLNDHTIAERFGFSSGLFSRNAIREADEFLLLWERRDLMNPSLFPWEGDCADGESKRVLQLPSTVLRPWKPKKAKREFLERFYAARQSSA